MTSGIAIILTALGIVPKLRGIGTPLGTPLIVSGFIEGGWRVALLQGLLIILSFVIFYPFFKKADNEAYEQEVSAEKTIASEA
ncbi:Lichenan permease IIC component [compost metagenome]